MGPGTAINCSSRTAPENGKSRWLKSAYWRLMHEKTFIFWREKRVWTISFFRTGGHWPKVIEIRVHRHDSTTCTNLMVLHTLLLILSLFFAFSFFRYYHGGINFRLYCAIFITRRCWWQKRAFWSSGKGKMGNHAARRMTMIHRDNRAADSVSAWFSFFLQPIIVSFAPAHSPRPNNNSNGSILHTSTDVSVSDCPFGLY